MDADSLSGKWTVLMDLEGICHPGTRTFSGCRTPGIPQCRLTGHQTAIWLLWTAYHDFNYGAASYHEISSPKEHEWYGSDHA